MRNFVFREIMSFFRKNNNLKIFDFELNFYNFPKKKLMLIRLLVTTLSPLGLTFFNSMLVLLAI
jgi:hypothetical protein